ncbi:MAG: TetR family transcriptional regulator [Flavobacteriaceae bacterium]|jgi:TetR/AcrR family transcriptional regulator|nr:TetR family transcriptional regulator [Flavobacteriaceae bacterium]
MTLPRTKPLSRIQTKNREKIKQAALTVFAEHGLRGATIDKIGEVSGMTKPNILYYYGSKDEIYSDVLNGLLDVWLEPLRQITEHGNPLDEILNYVRRKLKMSQTRPLESKLFATEILHGAPLTNKVLGTSLKELVDAKVELIQSWSDRGAIANVDGYHLLFSIWSMTQHYADFDIQVKAILSHQNDSEIYAYAEEFLISFFKRALSKS